MTRILDLQKLDSLTVNTDAGAADGSTSSWIGCSCSTASQTGCKAEEVIIAI